MQLSVADAVELLTMVSERNGIDRRRKEQLFEAVDRRRAEVVGKEVTFIANLNNNITTACNIGWLFCNFKDTLAAFEKDDHRIHDGFTKTIEEAPVIVRDAVERGIYEVT